MTSGAVAGRDRSVLMVLDEHLILVAVEAEGAELISVATKLEAFRRLMWIMTIDASLFNGRMNNFLVELLTLRFMTYHAELLAVPFQVQRFW